MTKSKYYGEYNYQNEVHKLFTCAWNEMRAHNNFIIKLAKILKLSRYKISCYFVGWKDNYRIRKVKSE